MFSSPYGYWILKIFICLAYIVCSTSAISPIHTKLKFVSNLTLIVFSTLLLEHGERGLQLWTTVRDTQYRADPYQSLWDDTERASADCSGSAGSEIKTPKIIFLNQILFFFWGLEPFAKFLKLSNKVCIAYRKEYILRNMLLGNFIFVWLS